MRLPSSRARQRLGDRVHDVFGQSVRLPSVVRLALAGVIGFAGLAFVFLAVGMSVVTLSSTRAVPHPVGARVVALMTAALGCGFAYVGWRLVQAHKAGDPLFGPRARVVIGLCLAVSAVGTAWNFVVTPGFGIGHLALFTGGWAAALLYTTLSKRQAARDAIRKPPARLPSLG